MEIFVDTSRVFAKPVTLVFMTERVRPHINLAQRLIITMNRYQQYLSKRLKAFDLGLSEYPILIYLFHRDAPDVKVSQSDIAQRQFRDPAIVTRAAKSLAKKGLINVENDPDNRARHVLTLTAEGRTVAKQVDDLVVAWEEHAFSDMTEEERRQLKRLLARLVVSD